jgi:hypothetical protein
MQIELKEMPFQIKLEEGGRFSGYGSVFDVVDTQNDVVKRGAFAKSISKGAGKVKMLWQHRWDEPIGVFEAMREDERGLYVEGKLLMDVQRGREAYALLKSGAMDGLSIGYSPSKFKYNNNGVRELEEVELWEVSVVTFPANQAATVTGVKNQMTERDFERFLRDEGKFSREEAKIIVSGGYKALTKQRDVVSDELILTLDKSINILKG